MKVLFRNFAALNILVVVLWGIATALWPARLYVHVKTTCPVKFTTNIGRILNVGKAGESEASLLVPTDFDCSEFVLTQCSGTNTPSVCAASLVRRFCLERYWHSQPAFAVSGEKKFVFKLENSVFRFRKGTWTVVLITECLLLLLSLLRLAGGKSRSTPQKTMRLDLLAALAFSCFVTLIVPLQTIVGNADELGVTVGSVIVELGGFFVVSFLVLAGLLRLGRQCLGDVCVVILTGLLIYEYLEVGVLSFGLPTLNGEIDFFMNGVRRAWDSVILIALILVAGLPLFVAKICRARISRVYLEWILLSMLVLSTASVFDAKKSLHSEVKSDIISHFVSKARAVRSCVHSPKKNVAVYVIDSVGIPHMQQVFRENPELMERFEGFVCYTNNIGMYPITLPATGGIATGEYYEDPSRVNDYAFQIFTSKSFIKPYVEGGADVFMMTGPFDVGVATRVSAQDMARESVDGWSVFKRMSSQLQWNLFEIVRLRLTPFCFKSKVYSATMIGWDASNSMELEECCYPVVATAPIREESSLTLQFWHTIGSHPPVTTDRFGNDDGCVRTGYRARVDRTYYVLRMLSDHLDRLKDRNLYDNTYLIVMADHGSQPADADNQDLSLPFESYKVADSMSYVPSRAQPIFLVKPLNARGRLRFSPVPTSQSRVHDLLVALAERNVGADESDEILRQEKRVYGTDDGRNIYHCVVDADRKVTIRRIKGADALPSNVHMQIGHVYSLCSGSQERAPIEVLNAHYAWDRGPLICTPRTPASLRFYVPEANHSYEIRLALKPRGRIEDFKGRPFLARLSTCGSIDKTEYGLEGNMKERILSVWLQSNAEGLLQLECEVARVCELHSIELR